MGNRTNIVIDDELMRAAKEATGLRTKRAVVEEALKLLVNRERQVKALDALWGSVDWEGNLREMRKDRRLPEW
jgi:Arc/MetJ family transcription regulator